MGWIVPPPAVMQHPFSVFNPCFSCPLLTFATPCSVCLSCWIFQLAQIIATRKIRYPFWLYGVQGRVAKGLPRERLNGTTGCDRFLHDSIPMEENPWWKKLIGIDGMPTQLKTEAEPNDGWKIEISSLLYCRSEPALFGKFVEVDQIYFVDVAKWLLYNG